LCGKWSRAKQRVAETKPAFEQLTDCLEVSLVQEWTAQEHVAMEQCGDHLKIYEVTSQKGGRIIDVVLGMNYSYISAQTLSEIRLKLSETEVHQGNLSGAVSAVTEGLAIEKLQ
jgi:hypothetical protein